MIKRIAVREEERGKRVKVGYDRIWVDGVWRRWDEEEEMIRDWRRIRGEKEMEKVIALEEIERGRENSRRNWESE